MSRIKDLYAEVENIDDLKPPKSVDLQWLADTVVNWSIDPYSEDYIAENAEFRVGDDDGEICMCLENFLLLCDNLARQYLDRLIKQEHIDLSDEDYADTWQKASDRIADYYSDYESTLCADELMDYNRDKKYLLDERKEQDGRV